MLVDHWDLLSKMSIAVLCPFLNCIIGFVVVVVVVLFLLLAV
jgi:hypothetical protein